MIHLPDTLLVYNCFFCIDILGHAADSSSFVARWYDNQGNSGVSYAYLNNDTLYWNGWNQDGNLTAGFDAFGFPIKWNNQRTSGLHNKLQVPIHSRSSTTSKMQQRHFALFIIH